ncbi:MAG TPA: ABC transporter ATP-binding protein, partial [Sphaerochaeta sp.]|nr:ABC transporter ATP-binding protein [Sphaerochaeta sp.]
MSELLTIDSISVSYGNIKALRTVSMHVDQGDIVCLIGANGAGKSTLLKAIVGLEPITTGTISYQGNIIAQASASGVKKRFSLPG